MDVTDSSPKSLYDRLGGRQAISEIIMCLYDRLLTDPRICSFWKGHSNDTKAREISSVIDFTCQATGGPDVYTGRDMRTSHDGLVIDQSDWAVFSELAVATLAGCGVPEKEKREILSFFDGFKEALGIREQPTSESDLRYKPAGGLTRRELEVLRLVGAGKNNPEIARELCISPNTVTRHLSNIFYKTGTTNRVEAAVYATRQGLS